MTLHRVWFLKYEEFDSGKVYLGDESHLNIIGRERVLTQFLDGRVKGINGVLHILGLAQNLLSISKLNDVGVQVVFSNGGCKMMRGAMVLTKGVWIGTLFQLDACTVQCNSYSVMERSLESLSSPSKIIVKRIVASTSNGCAFWVPKGAHSMEMKLPIEKTML